MKLLISDPAEKKEEFLGKEQDPIKKEKKKEH